MSDPRSEALDHTPGAMQPEDALNTPAGDGLAPNPQNGEVIMPTPSTCAGGCGAELPRTNKTGYAWGHKKGCPPPPDAEAPADGDAEPCISLDLSVAQIERIWQSLPLAEKALGLSVALTAERD